MTLSKPTRRATWSGRMCRWASSAKCQGVNALEVIARNRCGRRSTSASEVEGRFQVLRKHAQVERRPAARRHDAELGAQQIERSVELLGALAASAFRHQIRKEGSAPSHRLCVVFGAVRNVELESDEGGVLRDGVPDGR